MYGWNALYEFEFHYKRCYLHVTNKSQPSRDFYNTGGRTSFGRVGVIYIVGKPMLHYDLIPILKEVNAVVMLWEQNKGYADLPISEFLIKSLDQKGLGLPSGAHEVSFP